MSQRNDMNVQFSDIEGILLDLLAKMKIFYNNDNDNDIYKEFFGTITWICANFKTAQEKDDPSQTTNLIQFHNINMRRHLLQAGAEKHLPMLKDMIKKFKLSDHTQDEMASDVYQNVIKACDNSLISIDKLIPELEKLTETAKIEEEKIKEKYMNEISTPKNI